MLAKSTLNAVEWERVQLMLYRNGLYGATVTKILVHEKRMNEIFEERVLRVLLRVKKVDGEEVFLRDQVCLEPFLGYRVSLSYCFSD